MMSQRNGARLLCGVVVIMALSLGACGVPSETYTQALRDLDHSRDRLAQAEQSISTQRTALDNLRRANQKLNVRLAELEELTASQNVETVSLDRQLQRVTAEREELLLEIAEIEGQFAAIELGSDADDGSAIDPCPITEPGPSAEDVLATAGVGEKNVMMSTRHLSDRTIKLLPESYMFDEGSFTLSERAVGALCWIFTDVEAAAVRQLHVGAVVSGPSTGSQDQQFGTPWDLAAKRAVAIVRQLEAQGFSPDVSLVNRSSLKVEESDQEGSDQIDSTRTVAVQLGHITIEVVWSDKKPEFDAPHPLLGPSKRAPSRQEPTDPEAEQPADAESDAVDSPQTEDEPQS